MSKRKGAKRRKIANAAAVQKLPTAMRAKLAAKSEAAAAVAEACVPYRAGEKILVLGDGDFSFSRALAALGGTGVGICATGYDSSEDVHRKYGEVGAANIAELQRLGAVVVLSVDAMALQKCSALREWQESCQYVVFNFPHAGAGIKDEAENAKVHRALIRAALLESVALLTLRGEVHITLRAGRPYCEWAVPSLAESIDGLRFVQQVFFDPALYPGYTHRRTRGLAESRPDSIEERRNHAVTKGLGSVTYCFARV